MRNLVLTTLLFGAALPATGCIIVDDDDDDGPRGPIDLGGYDTVLLTSWKLVSGEPAQTATCKPGSNAAATLYTCPGDPEDCTSPATQAFVDIGNCNAGQSEGSVDIPYANEPTLALPPGRYSVWYEFSADNAVYAKSFVRTVDLAEGRTEDLDFQVQVDHGFFDVAWTLMRGSSAITCTDVSGLDAIALDVAPCVDAGCGAQGAVVQSVLECAPGFGRSFAIKDDAPAFDTAVAPIDANGDNLVDPAFKTMPAFAFGNEAQDLGTVVITFP